jgi:UDP-N-acetylglucosamine--N-acetylmuramyl-(pentapeptide) pyrophosphoryl-undecaprenol N-acetylglucosamine transferase
MKIIISGGGTGGHVFPAIAIADALKQKDKFIEILFVGAKGKLEMEKVPKAGYAIEGLWISGFQRKLTFKNLTFPIKLTSSMMKAWRIVRRFRPDVVVGVGGYASGPVLEVASRMGIPSVIQEQNSYAGITNRLLARKVKKVCVAYDGMERFFPKDRIVMTGNPVRKDLVHLQHLKERGLKHFGLSPDKKTLLVFGGSLGARTLNEMMAASFETIQSHVDKQVLWQVGKLYEAQFQNVQTARLSQVKVVPFIDRMDLAYAMADVVMCRAGALTISELCLAEKAAVLIPSPNVAEDHQRMNAMSLVDKGAARLVLDQEAIEKGVNEAFGLLDDEVLKLTLISEIGKLARPNAAEMIADEIIKLGKS